VVGGIATATKQTYLCYARDRAWRSNFGRIRRGVSALRPLVVPL